MHAIPTAPLQAVEADHWDQYTMHVLRQFLAVITVHEQSKVEMLIDRPVDMIPLCFACIRRQSSSESVFSYYEVYRRTDDDEEYWEFGITDTEVTEREDLKVQIEENVECTGCERSYAVSILKRGDRKEKMGYGEVVSESKRSDLDSFNFQDGSQGTRHSRGSSQLLSLWGRENVDDIAGPAEHDGNENEDEDGEGVNQPKEARSRSKTMTGG
jgi:hypothetical protein